MDVNKLIIMMFDKAPDSLEPQTRIKEFCNADFENFCQEMNFPMFLSKKITVHSL